MTDTILHEALHALLLPPTERIAIALAAVKSNKPPVFLDDEVMNALRQRGYTSLRECSEKDIPVGAQISTVGDGRVFVVEVTFEGRAFVERA